MAVAADAGSNATPVTAATAIDMTTLTVGSGSDRVLIVGLAFTGVVTISSVRWDSDAVGGAAQDMGVLTSHTSGSSQRQVYIYGLVNPRSGNFKCRAEWNTSTDADMWGASFTGCDQSGGTTTFPAAPAGTANSSSPAAITIPTASGDATVSCAAVGSVALSTPSHTQVYLDNSGTLRVGGMYSLSSSSSDAQQWTTGGASNWVMVGQRIAQAAAAAGLPWLPVTRSARGNLGGVIASGFTPPMN